MGGAYCKDEREMVASFLGVDAGAEEKVVARLACAGGDNVARNRSSYAGLTSCRAADLIAGGGKACVVGVGDESGARGSSLRRLHAPRHCHSRAHGGAYI